MPANQQLHPYRLLHKTDAGYTVVCVWDIQPFVVFHNQKCVVTLVQAKHVDGVIGGQFLVPVHCDDCQSSCSHCHFDT